MVTTESEVESQSRKSQRGDLPYNSHSGPRDEHRLKTNTYAHAHTPATSTICSALPASTRLTRNCSPHKANNMLNICSGSPDSKPEEQYGVVYKNCKAQMFTKLKLSN